MILGMNLWNLRKLNNSELSKPSIIDEANDFCAIEEFNDSFKSSEHAG